jgi:signal transduction histidine kinase/ActR/RegA family two-component response regulator
VAAVFAPVVRGYLFTAGLYYCVIAPLHPFYSEGAGRWILLAIALASAACCLAWALRLRRPSSLAVLELAALTGNAFVLGNVLVDQVMHFQEHQVFYLLLMPIAFALAGPTRRVAYASVAASLAAMIFYARQATGEVWENAGFLALVVASISIGMSHLIRGAVLRELKARLAAERLSERLRTELERNAALALSEQAANRTKSEFLATITHELRTPLNGVLGMAQAMSGGELDGEQRQRLQIIQRSGQALLSTINDVLDISKIEAGRFELVEAPFDLGEMADHLAALYGSLARDKGLAFAFEIAPQARGWRMGDEARLRQVFANLLSNALKFTEAGSIVARLAIDGERLTFHVEDTGVGVPDGAAPHLFEKFVQGDASTTRRFGGTGLGLAISREIVERMDGAVRFEPGARGGSLFEVEVRAPEAEAPQAQADEAGALAPLSVLVVDDNAVNRKVAVTLLAALGVTAREAGSAAEALDAWGVQAWDAILMDIHMPQMDGLEATAEIRRRERQDGRPRTPIIALTASVLAHETAAYRQAGMDDCVAKPIELAKLVEALQACLQTDDARRAATG